MDGGPWKQQKMDKDQYKQWIGLDFAGPRFWMLFIASYPNWMSDSESSLVEEETICWGKVFHFSYDLMQEMLMCTFNRKVF